MGANVSDEAFARYINQVGNATLDQIDAAKAEQARQAKCGVLMSLGDVLVKQGILTAAIRENIEKKLLAQQQGGIKQLAQFKLIKKLGEGGMGAVYLADDLNVGRSVAVKVLPKKHAGDVEFVTRFRREAKAAGQLNHVNIVSAYSYGEDQGYQYLAMEFCEGEPLDKILKRDGPLPWDKAIQIVMQIARGLKHAHEHNFVHRDIKPANVMLCKPLSASSADDVGVAKILDMGLSKNIGSTEQSFNTQTGVALGTPHYISPEQARGDRNIDGRSDIYSLGATFYHLVTGRTPFEGTTAAAVMLKHLNEQLPNPQDVREDVPDAVVHVIQRMMAKDAGDRYRDCAELLDDLEQLMQGKPPISRLVDAHKSSIAAPKKLRRQPAQGVRTVPNPVPHARIPQPAKRGNSLYIGGAIAAALLIVAGVIWSRNDSAEKERLAAKAAEAQKLEDEKASVEKLRLEVEATRKRLADEAELAKTKTTVPAGVPVVAPKKAEPENTLTLDLGGGVTMDLVRIPHGTFMMGSPPSEKDRKDDETQHEVTISKDFFMGKFTVTQEQYKAVIGKTPSYFKGAKNPVESVSWDDAQAFCKALQNKAQAKLPPGVEIQLPTEAQWEYACRAGTKTRFYSGDADNDLDGVAWFVSNSVSMTHPVGQKTPNTFGIYDMHGNVWQWCQDAYLKPYGTLPQKDPYNADNTQGADSVVRGGCWVNPPGHCRASSRSRYSPGTRGCSVGFRVVVAAAEPAAKAGEWLDVLSVVDPNLDKLNKPGREDYRTGKNTWEMRNGGLAYVSDGQSGKLKLPVAIDATEVDVAVEVSAIEDGAGFAMEIPTPSGEFDFFAGANNVLSIGPSAKLKFQPFRLLKDRKTTLLFHFKNDLGKLEATVSVDGVSAVKWNGDANGMLTPHEGTLLDGHSAGLWSYNRGIVFHSLKVRTPGGTAKLTRTGHAENTIPPKAIPEKEAPSELVIDLGGGVKLELVKVPAGEFIMGADDGDENEKPVHKVKISQPYYIGKYPVTVAQFRAFVAATKYRTEAEKIGGGATVKEGTWQVVPGLGWQNPGFKQDDNHPVVLVGWNDAVEFCKWTAKMSGRTVRLPTEAEWEYAARGPQSLKFPWGNKWDGIPANVADVSLRRAGFDMHWGESKDDDGYTFTSPVGTFKNASWCGAYDMAGNASQLCQDYIKNVTVHGQVVIRGRWREGVALEHRRRERGRLGE